MYTLGVKDESKEDSDGSDSDESDHEPIDGGNMLEQIFKLDAKENANKLGISYNEPSKLKPLKIKSSKNNKLY